MIRAADSLAGHVGIAAACRALRLPRSALYRNRAARHVCPLPAPASAASLRRPPLALSELERRVALDVLNSPRFANCAPAAIHAQLLDEGRYVASVRTMYRLLEGCAAVRERRDQLRHPEYAKPELLAVVPNQVWSWDITKLKGPVRGTCFHLYVILDIFSRYVVCSTRPPPSPTYPGRLARSTARADSLKRLNTMMVSVGATETILARRWRARIDRLWSAASAQCGNRRNWQDRRTRPAFIAFN